MNRTNELFNIFKEIGLNYDTINIIIGYEKQIIMNLSRKYHINISPMYDNLKKGFENLFLQPCYDESKDAGTNGKTFHNTFDMVMQNPGWNLSLQTHKWMGVE